MISDWSVPFTLTTPAGNLSLNAASGNRYLLLNEECSSGASVRFTADNIPQSDGQLNHRQYLTGYRMNLAMGLWVDGDVACGGEAQEMLDDLGAHIEALRNPEITTDVTRIVWTPEGLANRMINDIVLAGDWNVTVRPRGDDAGIVAVTFPVVSAFPYEMSEAEQTPATVSEGTGLGTTLTNDGNTRFWPVLRVQGPASWFEIHNLTTGEAVYYDASRPGAMFLGTSEYVEIDNFRATAYLNGDEDNMLPGIDFEQTDFWALEPGANDIAAIGADLTILWNDAWL